MFQVNVNTNVSVTKLRQRAVAPMGLVYRIVPLGFLDVQYEAIKKIHSNEKTVSKFVLLDLWTGSSKTKVKYSVCCQNM